MVKTKTAKNTFTVSRRQKLLGEFNRAKKEIASLGTQFNAAGTGKQSGIEKKLNDASKQFHQALEAYETGLPRHELSRCPFTGVPVKLAIDTFGLDGPWWDFEAAARPLDEQLPSVFAFSGAMDIKSTPPKTPFLCKPGPGAPFVVPRLLVNPAVKAVISTIKVGKLTAWPVFYFAEETPYDLVRINDWGRDYYVAETAHGEGYTMETYDYYIDYDFDLEFYIRSGRLLWIEPGDEKLKLNSTIDHCPYLGLKGRQFPIAIHNGKLWNSLLDEEALESGKQSA